MTRVSLKTNQTDIFILSNLFSLYRYEIREDRRRENLRSDRQFERLRADLNTVLSGTDRDRGRPNVSTNRSMHTRSSDSVYDNKKDNVFLCKNDNTHRKLVYRTASDDPRNLTSIKQETLAKLAGNSDRNACYSAKIESYLSHLEDDISNSTFVSHPLPHITNDPFRSHTGLFDAPRVTTYGHRLYSAGNQDSVDTHDSISEDNTFCLETSFNHVKQLPKSDIDAIKLEIMTSLKTELRNAVREITQEIVQPSSSVLSVPEMNSDLYHTHLYTQL